MLYMKSPCIVFDGLVRAGSAARGSRIPRERAEAFAAAPSAAA